MTVMPSAFVKRMVGRWESLGNISSSSFEQLWFDFVTTLNNQLHESEDETYRTMKVFPAETGTGKTQGLAVYCSMLPENRGVLIVTRLKDEADKLASFINELSACHIAVAHHSDNKVKLEDQQNAQILIITHKAYEISISENEFGVEYEEWRCGIRDLTVIDEAFDWVKSYKLDLDEFRGLLGDIPFEYQSRYPAEIEVLNRLKGSLEKFASKRRQEDRKGGKVPERIFGFGGAFYWENLTTMKQEMKKDKRIDAEKAKALSNLLNKVMGCIQELAKGSVYYSCEGNKHIFATSKSILPSPLPNVVILDATASSNTTYDLMDGINVLSVPKVRNYSNVRLHVKRMRGVGKGAMSENKEKRSCALINDLGENLCSENSILVCCHENVEATLVSYAPPFNEFSVGYWGAIDGRNDWQDHSAVVIFGLTYLPSLTHILTYAAFKGMPSQDWFDEPEKRKHGKHRDILRGLEIGHLVTSCVQAINRVRCRKVTSSQGSCMPTSAYIMLPIGTIGDEILSGIRNQMPGIEVSEWNIELEPPQPPKVRKSKVDEAICVQVKNMEVGTYSLKDICDSVGASKSSYDRIHRKLKCLSGSLYETLESLGATLTLHKYGRGHIINISKS